MRWIRFMLLAYVLVVLQSTVGAMLRFRGLGVESIGPDILAAATVFMALHVRSGMDAMLAGWILGFALDLTTTGGPGGATLLGPMSFLFALAGRAVYQVREAFFRDRVLTQAVLTLFFCLGVHCVWVTVQALAEYKYVSWSAYADMLAEALALSVYSAVLAPFIHAGLARMQKVFFAAAGGRMRRA